MVLEHKNFLLQEARRKKGLTQQQVANMLGITVRSYQRYEYGERRISLDTAIKLSEILDVDVYDLAGRKSTSNAKSA
jgi:transcriptional regulator with XRE-family HTH domain